MSEQNKWICSQLGGREHYAVPRALHKQDRLAFLITDLWVRGFSLAAVLKRNLEDRFDPDLTNAKVHSFNVSALGFEAAARLRGLAGWTLIQARNRLFQRHAITALRRYGERRAGKAVTLFGYSYASHDLLKFARVRGWRTVLGQIDAGPVEERIVGQLYRKDAAQIGRWQPAPPDYWDSWRRECEMADRIVVNSVWSRDALLREGVAAEKIKVVPLAFKGGPNSAEIRRQYPAEISQKRPLRVLFLGQINLRKGVGPLLEAARVLHDKPVEFWFVGPIQISVPTEFRREARIRWIGAVPPGEVARYYREADVLVFPTFSDGFGLTQLEAQSWKLPVIASRFCGEVVTDNVNGVLLRAVSVEEIVDVLLSFLNNPGLLRDMSTRSGVEERFSLDSLASSLASL